MRSEYVFDYANARRGKHYDASSAATGHRKVLLDEDVAAAFRTSRAVNDALRALLKVARGAAVDAAERGRRRSAAERVRKPR